MIELALIRHAEVKYNGDNNDKYVHLTKCGHRSARGLAKMDFENLQAIYSSPLPRAMETVEPLSKERGVPIIPHLALRELEYKGNAQEFHEKTRDNHFFHFDGGETLTGATSRFTSGLEKICQEYSDGLIVVSTHGTVLSQFLINKFHMPKDTFHKLGYPSMFICDYDGDFINLRRII